MGGLPEEKVQEWKEEPLSFPLCSSSSHFWSSPACSVDHSQLPVAMCFVPPNHAATSTTSVLAESGTRRSATARPLMQHVLADTPWMRMAKCYILRKGQSSWSDANTRCQNEGDVSLAKITSANENTAMQTVVTGASGKAYIGLTDSATEMTWLWTDGSSMS